MFAKGAMVRITKVIPWQANDRLRFVGKEFKVTLPGCRDLYGPYIFETGWRWDYDQLELVEPK